MMTFISCAKTMTARSKTPYPETSTPHFLKEARENALYMTQFTAEITCATTSSFHRRLLPFRRF